MKPLILGNWKQHKNAAESEAYLLEARTGLEGLKNVEVVLCPPFTSLAPLASDLKDSPIKLGAQDVSPFEDGAYTGEVSAKALASLCQYVIVGHSERRKMGETAAQVNDKVRRCIEVGLQPVVCVSNEGEVRSLVELKGEAPAWIIAFEPIEAIGSGKPEDPAEVEQMVALIKQHLGDMTRVIYGGSAKAENVGDYVPLTEGALVGGASLEPASFIALCSAVDA